ncbi:MAG: PilZ domain-containing protein [Gammaproteobacteria bacterium]|nr:PilZ domain-containing protein [Gammaproteobacteria bacterium]
MGASNSASDLYQTGRDSDYGERRRSTRIRFDEPVESRLIWREGTLERLGPPLKGKGIDLSLHGLQLSVPFPMPPGQAVHVNVRFLDREQELDVDGTIVWCGNYLDQLDENEFCVGVELTPTSHADPEWQALFAK